MPVTFGPAFACWDGIPMMIALLEEFTSRRNRNPESVLIATGTINPLCWIVMAMDGLPIGRGNHSADMNPMGASLAPAEFTGAMLVLAGTLTPIWAAIQEMGDLVFARITNRAT